MSEKTYIPEPRPQFGKIEISAFYYPGTEQMAEWDMVEQTLPNIKPLLGWYDEGNPEVVDWQIKWAVEHGISSFCVDWYWNQGVQRLDHWIKAYYRARFRSYLKWFIMWANHNEAGAHSTSDQSELTRFWIENYFKTPEYYTDHGRPVVAVWSLENLDRDFIAEAAKQGETLAPGNGCRRALELSNRIAIESGLPGICFINMYHGTDMDLIKCAGFEKNTCYNLGRQFTLDALPDDPLPPGDSVNHLSFDYMVKGAPKWWEKTSPGDKLPFIPIVPTGWDDRPRSFQHAAVIYDKTPEKFGELCRACRSFCEEQRIKHVMIAPLNEWQEGSYIEPNQKFGFGFYDALRDAFCEKPVEGWPENIRPEDVGRGPYDYPPIERLAQTSWDFSESVMGWYRNPFGTGGVKIVNGAMHFWRSGASHVAIRTRIAPFEAAQFKKCKIRMRLTPNPAYPATGDDRMKLYWGTKELPIFSQELVISELPTVTLPVIADGAWHEYELDVAANSHWRGRIEELWLDPICLTFCHVDIKKISFE